MHFQEFYLHLFAIWCPFICNKVTSLVTTHSKNVLDCGWYNVFSPIGCPRAFFYLPWYVIHSVWICCRIHTWINEFPQEKRHCRGFTSNRINVTFKPTHRVELLVIGIVHYLRFLRRRVLIVGDYGGFFLLRDDLDAVANPNKRRMTKSTKLNRIFSLFSSLVVNKLDKASWTDRAAVPIKTAIRQLFKINEMH